MQNGKSALRPLRNGKSGPQQATNHDIQGQKRVAKNSLGLTILKNLKLKKTDGEQETPLSTLLKSQKMTKTEKSRSVTPQKVFHCSPKLSKSPKPSILKKSKLSDAAAEHSIKVQQKLLSFGKSKVRGKKKDLSQYDMLSPSFKKRESEKSQIGGSQVKKAVKPKKKKKLHSEKNESLSKEDTLLHFNDSKKLKDASTTRRNQQGSNMLKYSFKQETPKRKNLGNGILLQNKKPLGMSLFDILESAAILIQKHVRGYICRQRLGRFLQSILESAHSEGILEGNRIAGDMTPLPSEGPQIKPMTSDHSKSSSLLNERKYKSAMKERSLRNISIKKWQKFDLNTEYSEVDGSIPDAKIKTRFVPRPPKTVDKAVQSEAIEMPRPPTSESKTSKNDSVKNSQKKTKDKNPTIASKKVNAVGTQVSFREVKGQSKPSEVRICAPIIIHKEVPEKMIAPSSSRANLEKLAKDEYKKWSQVDQLLARMNKRTMNGKPLDMNEVFTKIEELANQSKFSLKKKYNLQESRNSLLSLSKTPTIQSLNQHIDEAKMPSLKEGRMKIDIPHTKSIGSSPISSPLIPKLQDRSMEKWPIFPDIQKSLVFNDARSSDNPLFESIDEKLDKLIQKEQKGISSSLKWSGRMEPDQSESVIRSMLSEKDVSFKGDCKPSPSPLPHIPSKDSLIGLSGISQPQNLASMNQCPSVSENNLVQRYHTPHPTEFSDYTPTDKSLPQLPVLIKNKSKKTVIDIRPVFQGMHSIAPEFEEKYLEHSSFHELARAKSSSSLQEINLALQSILDDLGGESPTMNDLLNDSTRRIETSDMWNLDSPKSSVRQSARDHTMAMLVDLIVQSLVEDTLKETLWKKSAARLTRKEALSSKDDLSEKFKKIDELLSYDDNLGANKVTSFKDDKPLKKEDPIQKRPQMYPENILDDNIEEDIEKSGDDQSEAETVYGIRTNFNAVNEYLNLLLKFLREKLPELKLPVSKNTRPLVLRRIHNLERELKENLEKNVPVKSIHIPKRPGRKERTALACFAREEPESSFLPAGLFISLEEDILVGLLKSVCL